MRSTSLAVPALGALLFAGCTDDPPPTDPPTWEPLVTASWSLAPGEERTSQVSLTAVPDDVAITAIRPIAPLGTHHTLLAKGDASLTDGTFIYASGVGTPELAFPPGAAMKLEAGQLLGLQLHIYNIAETTLTGTSGVEVQTADPTTIQHDVDLFLPGPKDLAIAPGVATARGTCTVTAPQTVFAVFPHMHQYGTHLTTTLTAGGVPRVIYDDAYSFEHQKIVPFESIELAPGDTITTECTWNNTTGATITYGESSDTEMCYSILFRYPDDGREFCEQ
ncbi:MAG: hypothetical protein IPL61_27180 [Myxococcales bacterium]|nr:hypothetical protein [Myxococcales bacterium]